MLLAGGGGNSPLNEITQMYGGGFTPQSLSLSWNATLAGSRLRLTDGGRDEAGAAYDTTPVDVSRNFSTTFQFQFTPNGTDPLGSGITFVLQNSAYSPGFNSSLDALGVTQTPHLAVKFGTYDAAGTPTNDPTANHNGFEYSDNSTGLYLGMAQTGFQDAGETYVPKNLVDFHSGHVFQCTLSYAAPSGITPGSLTETIRDTQTGSSWSTTYNNVNIQSIFSRADVTGQYAYAGFAATTGSPANPVPQYNYTFSKGAGTQDVLSWTWSDPSTSTTPMPYAASFTLAQAETTSSAVYDADGDLVRTLWQANTLAAGTYQALWDGLGQGGVALDPASNPGPYSFRVVQDTATVASRVVGNTTTTPQDPTNSIAAIYMGGVAVSSDGSTIWAAGWAGDTAGGQSIKVLNGDGTPNAYLTGGFYLNYFHMGEAVAADDQFIYAIVQNDWGTYTVERMPAHDPIIQHADWYGFTDASHHNQDGSFVDAGSWGSDVGYNLYHRLNLVTTPAYHVVPQIAVTGAGFAGDGVMWVTDLATGRGPRVRQGHGRSDRLDHPRLPSDRGGDRRRWRRLGGPLKRQRPRLERDLGLRPERESHPRRGRDLGAPVGNILVHPQQPAIRRGQREQQAGARLRPVRHQGGQRGFAAADRRARLVRPRRRRPRLLGPEVGHGRQPGEHLHGPDVAGPGPGGVRAREVVAVRECRLGDRRL